jgi:cyanophycin synthetase
MSARACTECGADAVDHRLTYITVAVDEALRPFFTPSPFMRSCMSLFYALERVATPIFFETLIHLGLATALSSADERTTLLGKTIWEEAQRRGIEVREVRIFGLPRNIFLARFPHGKKIAYEGIPLPPEGTAQAWWMDNKAELKKRFRKLGIPVAKGGDAMTLKGANRIFRKLTPPAIVKPFSGSGSRHTTMHINDEETLEKAFRSACMLAPMAIIEEELRGLVHRVTLVDGKVVAALRRYPPSVVGDGFSSLPELVAKENENPLREGPYFSKIQLGDIARHELEWQNLTETSIPEKGRRVFLHPKMNWSVGGTTEDATDELHPENIALFERVAKALAAPVVGIDLIMEDIGRPWQEQERCGILECNSMPFLENHHIVFSGKPRNVAGAVWDMVS